MADRELFLIPTAEVPLTNLHAQETLAVEDLPLAYTAHTPCFRSEAGSYGRDTRGLIRHARVLQGRAGPVRRPGPFPRRSWRCCSRTPRPCCRGSGWPTGWSSSPRATLGFSAEFTYDIEVWLPGQRQLPRDLLACRTSARSRPAGPAIRTKAKDGRRGFAATLNGSGLPIGRTLVAILEQGQQADGSVRIPEALVPYTGFAR